MKFIETQTGKEVTFGDFVKFVDTEETETYRIERNYTFLLNEDNFQSLVLDGVIQTVKDKTKDLEYYLKQVSEDAENMYLPSLFSAVLKKIAVDLDDNYKDHISKSEHIYCISMTNGRIVEIPKAVIKNYKNFAAFRTIEDAKYACRITRPLLKKMFKNDIREQKN